MVYLFYRHPFSHEHPWFWQAGLQVANLGKAALSLKIEYAASGGRVWDKHRATGICRKSSENTWLLTLGFAL